MTKIELIEKALNDDVIKLDDAFVRACRERMQNEKQLDALQADISDYRRSSRCLKYVNCYNMMSNIGQWSNWRFVTLTFAPNWRKWHNPIVRNATEHAAKEAQLYVKRFNEELSRCYFSRAAIKNKSRVRMVAKIGGDNIATNIHYHAIIEVPTNVSSEQFDQAVSNSWSHGKVDSRRFDNDLKSVCMYVLDNEKQLGKIGGELFNVNILHTSQHC